MTRRPSDFDEYEVYRRNLARALGPDIIAQWDKEDAEFQAELDRRMAAIRDNHPLARLPLAERIAVQERDDEQMEEAFWERQFHRDVFDEDEID